ncbi:MAG: hypothetical protein ABH952_07760 [Candidatus Omnitrophota bacterium]
MFNVTVLNYEKVLFTGQAKQAILPCVDGELSILEFHQPLLAALRDGILKIDEENIPVSGGLAGMARNELIVLCEG